VREREEIEEKRKGDGGEGGEEKESVAAYFRRRGKKLA